MFLFSDVSFASVLTAAIVFMIVGFLWYSKWFFGIPWQKAAGIYTKECEEKQGWAILGAFLLGFLMAYVLGYLIVATHSTTLYYGMLVAFFCWLGFAVPALGLPALFGALPSQIFWIDALHLLVVLLLMGGILATLNAPQEEVLAVGLQFMGR